MNSHQSGLRFLPPPFHHPGWRSHAHHEFLSQKMGPSCLFASRRKDHEPSCLAFGTEKCPPAVQPEVPALPGLEIKDSAFPVLQSGPPQPPFPPSSLPQPPSTTFPPPTPYQELTSAAPTGNVHRRSPPSSPSDFAEKSDYEMPVLLKPNYGLGERKGEEEEEEEEEAAAAAKIFLQKAPSLDLPKTDKTSPGKKIRSGHPLSGPTRTSNTCPNEDPMFCDLQKQNGYIGLATCMGRKFLQWRKCINKCNWMQPTESCGIIKDPDTIHREVLYKCKATGVNGNCECSRREFQ